MIVAQLKEQIGATYKERQTGTFGKYIDKIYVTPIDETHMEMKIKLFTNETTTKYLENLRVRTGHTFKKMIESYENSMK